MIYWLQAELDIRPNSFKANWVQPEQKGWDNYTFPPITAPPSQPHASITLALY